MIFTITLNPAIDNTLSVRKLILGEVNRSSNGILDIGGKGINVSRAIKAIGGDSVVLGFCGSANGRFIKNKLTSIDILHDFIDVNGEVRTNIKIIDDDGNHTDINEAGFEVHDPDFLRLLDKVDMFLNDDNIFVLSGTNPSKFSQVNYEKLCQRITGKNNRLIIDADGENLLSALKSKPYFIKPNRIEASKATGITIHTPEDALEAAKKLCEMGATSVCVSGGGEGAVFYKANETPLYIKPPKVEACGPVGAGDAMVGGFVKCLLENKSFEECAKTAVAIGTASTIHAGTSMPSLKEVFVVYNQLEVYTME